MLGLFGSDSGEKDGENTQRGGFTPSSQVNPSRQSVRRIIDEEAEVVIYLVGDSTGTGLTSVPLKDTELDIDNQNPQFTPK